MSAAAFAGQMEATQNFAIDQRFVDFAKQKYGCDLLTPKPDDLVAVRHMRLVATSLTLFAQQVEVAKFSHFLGYSVGQFAALTAMSLIDEFLALELVALRAQCLQKAWQKNPSKMFTVVGVPDYEIEKVVSQFPNQAFVSARNAKMNTSIGVDSQVSFKIEKELANLKPIKIIAQPGCGAWHTPFMDEAVDDFRPILQEKLMMKSGHGHFVEHTSGQAIPAENISRDWLIDNLLLSIKSPVECRAMFETLKTQNIFSVTEFGLSPFLVKIVPFISRDFRIRFLE